jgi:hypothetical protein
MTIPITDRCYYFPVEIHGVALVYAETEDEARKQLENAEVRAAGNNLRHSNVDVLGPSNDLGGAIRHLISMFPTLPGATDAEDLPMFVPVK